MLGSIPALLAIFAKCESPVGEELPWAGTGHLLRWTDDDEVRSGVRERGLPAAHSARGHRGAWARDAHRHGGSTICFPRRSTWSHLPLPRSANARAPRAPT